MYPGLGIHMLYFVISTCLFFYWAYQGPEKHKTLHDSKVMSESSLEPDSRCNIFCYPLFPLCCSLKALLSYLLTQSWTQCYCHSARYHHLWCRESKRPGLEHFLLTDVPQNKVFLVCGAEYVCMYRGGGWWKQRPVQEKSGEVCKNLSVHMLFFSWGFSENFTSSFWDH